MKKFLFILLIVIIASRIKKSDEIIDKETKVDEFEDFLKTLDEGEKQAYVWFVNENTFDEVKTELIIGDTDKAQRKCQTYCADKQKCIDFIGKYNGYLTK